MRLQDLLPLPWKNRQARSEDSSEASSIDETDSAVTLATGSDLRTAFSGSTSTPSTLFSRKHDDDRIAPDRTKPVPGGRESTTNSATKSAIDIAKEPSDASSPLKSVVECLSAVLERCDPPMECRQTVESLVPRVEALAQSLRDPASGGGVEGKGRREALERKLDSVVLGLAPLAQRGRITRFPNNAEDVSELGRLVEDIRNAMVDYQTPSQHDMDMTTIINGMHPAADAGHRSGNRQGCLKGTRVDLLLQLESWLGDEQDHVFWLSGLAGTGKSTIAQTFAEINFAGGKLGASFFCSRNYEDRSNLRAIFPTLAFQLAHQYPQFCEELLRVLRISPSVGRESLCSQMEKVIVGPLKATRIQTLIIIDALDECKDEEPTPAILSVLSRYVDEIPRVKFFIAGRPEPRIRSGFWLESFRPIAEAFRLHDITCSSVDNDIKLLLETRLAAITKTRGDYNFMGDWSSSYDINIIREKAEGLFIYASTVVKFIASEHHTPTERLALITSLPSSTRKAEKKKETSRLGLDDLYVQILEQVFRNAHADGEGFNDRFRSVVGAISLMFNPLPMEALSRLLRVSNIPTVLTSLHSLLLVPNSGADPILVFHKSFPDFLTDPGRCKDKRFFINPSVHHREILLSCLSLMKEVLKRNICDLDDHASLDKVEDLPTRRKAQIGDALEYACRFWTKHLVGVPSSGHDVGEVYGAIDEFFTTRLLFWIEVLIVTGNFDAGIYAIDDIRQWYTSVGSVCKWVDDSQRLILEHTDMIRDSPSEIYHYALPFCPPSSWLREYYSAELSREVEVVRGLPAERGECSLAVSHLPRALACGKGLIAIGLWSGDITIVDATARVPMSVLSGHTDWVASLAFSPDGTLLVSGSNDKTIKFWDIQTGGVCKTLSGHTGRVCSVSISPDLTTVASGSEDKTIRLWDVRTGECHRTMGGHNGAVNSISFSPTDRRLLVSASEDHTIRQWDIDDYRIVKTYEGDHVAFSSDGALFVSWRDEVATVRIPRSGVVTAELRAPSKYLQHCCFSPDGKFVAGAVFATIYVWNITKSPPNLIETFVGHTEYISRLAFSSSLISSSRDKSIKFWNIGTSSTNPVVTDPESASSAPPAPAPVESVSLQATAGIAISSDSAGVVRTWDISNGLCKRSFKTLLREAERGDAGMVGNTLAVCWFTGRKIHLLDTATGELMLTVDVPYYYHAFDLRISGDGSKIFLLDHEYIRAWSISTGEAVGEVKLESEPLFGSLIVDGSRAWVRFKDLRVRGWDFELTGSSPALQSGFALLSMPIPRVDFFDHTQAWDADPSRIVDTVTGREVFRLFGRYGKPTAVRWDGRYLIAGYDSGEVLILDFNLMTRRR